MSEVASLRCTSPAWFSCQENAGAGFRWARFQEAQSKTTCRKLPARDL